MDEIQVQVNPCHYDFLKYVKIGRWCSYYHQISETLKLKPQNVLVIGIGDNIVGKILSLQGIDVSTYDFDKELNPDFVGNITDLDLVLHEKTFDVVLVCQILEHLPYSQFEDILKKLRSIGAYVIMSLPHTRVNLTLSVKLHHCDTQSLNFGLHQFWKKLKFHGEHYWEVGKGKHTKRKIQKSIKKYFSIEKRFLAVENHDHIFYVLYGNHQKSHKKNQTSLC